MTKRPPLAVILIVIVICFILGLLNVLLREPEVQPTSTYLPPTPSEFAPVPIHNILIIGVDDLTQNSPNLRAIWIASNRPSEKIIYFHGIPIDAQVPGVQDKTLDDAFEWTYQKGISHEFIDNLYEIIPLHPTLTILMDEVAFTRTIDYLGGVEIRGKTLDGESVLTFLSPNWDQPEILIENQADIIRSIIPKALGLPETPELTELFALIPDHASLSMEISQAVSLILPLREIPAESIFIILINESTI